MGYVLEGSYQFDRPPTIMRTDEEIDGFIGALLDAGPEFTAATLYAVDEVGGNDEPDHQVVIGVNKAAGLGGISYAGDDGEWFSQGEQINPAGVVFVYFGTGHDFPSDSEVPLGAVRQALRELLTNQGKRPVSMSWQRWEQP